MINHPSLLVNILIVLGEGFWVFNISAQLLKTYRTRNTRGLSAITQMLNAAGNVAWATYFFINHLWFPFSTNVMMFFLGTAELGYLLSNRKQFVKSLCTLVIVAPLTSYLLVRNPAAGGWIGMVYNWVASTPWLYRVVKYKKVSGISEQGIYFAFGAMSCVLTYGIIVHSWPLIAVITQSLVYELIICRYYYRYRNHKGR